MNNDYKNKVSGIVFTLLDAEKNPTFEFIRKKVDDVVRIVPKPEGLNIDVDQLAREIEAKISVFIDYATTLDNNEGHKDWLMDKRAKVEWKFWKRYRKYLETSKGMPPLVVDRLDGLTDKVLERLEDPARDGAWDTRGMVVGRVQSGKTGNYIGLVCKAIDSGYKVIVILAGMHDSLRAQTQLRIDEGILGFDTQKSRSYRNNNEPIGVGKLVDEKLLIIHPFTSSDDKGDFSKKFAQQAPPIFGGEPIILVVKKNKSVLNNLLQWAVSVRGVDDPSTGKKVIPNIPLLLIDDEADNASVNTKKIPVDDKGKPMDDYDVTAINGTIRQILDTFTKSAYVAYTATPFANIFISGDNKTDTHGKDLFPKNFIINLPTPTNYIGASKIFGVQADPISGVEESPGLPLIRDVDDYEDAFPLKHRKDHVPEELPGTLNEAIRAFILVCAARAAGGQATDHNSMLIHVTRFNDVQGRVAELVEDELRFIRLRLEMGDGNASESILEELEDLWKSDFEPTTAKMKDNDSLVVDWVSVKEKLYEACAKITVKILNGKAKDALDYADHKDTGLNVIAIGGDKLSRGLTLEGLSVSYYLRSTKMYDTLMQMGRWFGYRPGYMNLCRLYTTSELLSWYKHITLASEELLADFDTMAAVDGTPEEYGLKVRMHPESMLIVTALNKMRSGVEVPISYSEELVELVYYHKEAKIHNANLVFTDEFIKGLGEPEKVRASYLWKNVPGVKVVSFLDGLITHPSAVKVAGASRYIRDLINKNELADWTIMLASNNKKDGRVSLGNLDVGMTDRKDGSKSKNQDVYIINKSHIISSRDEYEDLSPDEWEKALNLTRNDWANRQGKRSANEPKEPTGKFARKVRSPQKGMLIIYVLNPTYADLGTTIPVIGYAISFPESPTAVKTNYLLNQVAIGNIDEE
jgi:hypothetical protein